jgi:hypothetical protein
MWGFVKTLGLLLFLGCVAQADAGLMLGESTGQGMSRWTSAGHSAVYLSRVCPDGPVRLRLCAPGEQGSVLSNYINFSEDKPYEWNVVPLSVFLYGVDDPKDRPLYASPGLRAALQERFRQERLGEICPDGTCTDGKANWRDVVAANFIRDIYMFEVSTTVEQDEAFVRKFNALPNVDHYNGFTRNCADFARLVINTYFPGAAQPDHINDFWMTSPKAISKSFTHYAVQHPERSYRVVRFTQIPGSYRRSRDARKGTEVTFTSKKWFFPMLLRSNDLMLFTASYMLTGRFNPELELRRRPTTSVTAEMTESREAREAGDDQFANDLELLSKSERNAVFGTKAQWGNYSDALAEFRGEFDVRSLELDTASAKSVANALDEHGHVVLDPDGPIWIVYRDGDSVRRVGVSASNVNAPGSDGELAYALLLARSSAELLAPPKNREMLPEFQADWQLLEEARRNLNWKILARRSQAFEPASAQIEEDLVLPGDTLLP